MQQALLQPQVQTMRLQCYTLHQFVGPFKITPLIEVPDLLEHLLLQDVSQLNALFVNEAQPDEREVYLLVLFFLFLLHVVHGKTALHVVELLQWVDASFLYVGGIHGVVGC